jgi:cytochrome c-type biogenesis protein CcmH/NrfG
MAVSNDGLASLTLAELYFKQGDFPRAIQTVSEVLKRDPENEKARERLEEIKKCCRETEQQERHKRVNNLNRVLDRIKKEKQG